MGLGIRADQVDPAFRALLAAELDAAHDRAVECLGGPGRLRRAPTPSERPAPTGDAELLRALHDKYAEWPA